MSTFFFDNITISRNDFGLSNDAPSHLKQKSGSAQVAHAESTNIFFATSTTTNTTNYFSVAAASSKIETPTCPEGISACPSDMIDESDFNALEFCLNAPLIKKSSSIQKSSEIEVTDFSLREEGNSFGSSLGSSNNSYIPNFSLNSIDISDFSL